ncbi:MAG: beta-aspartate methyltransferase [Deltaproteobacteria bacterium RBG_19FT_COMBO_46_12]|nr:MAG: beta-aspartate methyltransferase [Deltaproteobacteria bacterium RBG_19FT_COMBO_46_12]
MVRIIHYINQFFGQIGGEEKAGIPPRLVQGPVGPGSLIDKLMEGQGEIIATLICGDNYFSEKTEEAMKELLKWTAELKPDLLMAGPAFNAGRYGVACGEICKRVRDKLGVPSVTGMYPENPGVDLYKKPVYIIETTRNTSGMEKAMSRMIRLGLKLVREEPMGKPSEEGYIPKGIKKNVLSHQLASQRAIELLLKKIKGEPFQTEISFPNIDLVPPAPPISDLGHAKIALVTEGGLVPKGNPEHLESARATRYGKYDIGDLKRLSPTNFESIHRGFDTQFVNEDPNRLVPLDVLRHIEREGIFKEIFPIYFVTTGVATTLENGRRIGNEIALDLKTGGVSGAILTAT